MRVDCCLDSSTLKTKAEQLSTKKRRLDEDEEEDSSGTIFRKTCPDQFSRVDLVLNLKQLILGNYPCPIYNEFNNFKQIKSSYKPVTSSSRIFALDVETVGCVFFDENIEHHDRFFSFLIRRIIDKFLIGLPLSMRN